MGIEWVGQGMPTYCKGLLSHRRKVIPTNADSTPLGWSFLIPPAGTVLVSVVITVGAPLTCSWSRHCSHSQIHSPWELPACLCLGPFSGQLHPVLPAMWHPEHWGITAPERSPQPTADGVGV